MESFRKTGAAIAALAGLAWGGAAVADIRIIESQLVQQELKKGDATVAVRLVNTKTGKSVPDAVIIAKRLDMAPDAMAEMATRLDPLPSTEPGVYRIQSEAKHGGPVAALAWREGSRRDRHCRKQADSDGHQVMDQRTPFHAFDELEGEVPAKRTALRRFVSAVLLTGVIAVGAGLGYRLGRADHPLPGWIPPEVARLLGVQPPMPGKASTGPVIYYRDPDGKPFYSRSRSGPRTGGTTVPSTRART